MSFRFRMVILTIVLMTVLFSVGGTMLIHTSFQASLEKEEQTAVAIHETILRMVQYVGKDGTWITEEKLTSIIENVCKQDAIDSVQLMYEGELVYANQKGTSLSKFMNKVSDIEENQVQISYFIRKDDNPMQEELSKSDKWDMFSFLGLTSQVNGKKIELGEIYNIKEWGRNVEAEEKYMQSSIKFVLNNRTYYLDTCRNLTDIYKVRAEQIAIFQNIFLLLSLFGSAMAWLVVTFMTRHLRKLTRATKEIGRGNLSYRSKIKSQDEVGELATAFDNMAEKLEKNITLLKEAAEQKEQFMGAFTHELKTPMTSIIGYADLLRTQKVSKADQTDALNYIFSEAKRLENLSLKMLDLFVADKKDVEMKWCSPSKLVTYMVSHLRRTFMQEGISIVLQTEEGECLLEPDLFQTLCVNLLDNARKSMEHGGTITVAVKMQKDGCILSVKDEGKGIPKEALEHLTEAFYRVDKARARSNGSAGLGLALCEKIVELHHGRMEFESEEGVGTLVTVYFKSTEVNLGEIPISLSELANLVK